MMTDRPGHEAPQTPSVAEMFTEYLRRRAAAGVQGPSTFESAAEVVPFEAVPVPPVDPRLAWDETLVAARLLCPTAVGQMTAMPPDWAMLVHAQEPVPSVAFCLGNYPQLVRDLHGLLQADDLASLLQPASRPIPAPELSAWAEQAADRKQFPDVLVAAAVLRLTRDFERAAELVHKLLSTAPETWQPALANEQAALAWHRGGLDEAAALWDAQPATVPVLFNRGMAGLFRNRPSDARRWLAQAVAQLPEDGAWHHLGRLYLALAEMRG